MKSPPTPIDEAARLCSLQLLNILDTDPEERFDRLTRLARRLFDVPIALVSLIDQDRQWFKSHAGLDARETPRDISFCGHAILGDDVFLVSDASRDPRFLDNPLVTGEPNIRFYAGCPLVVGNGHKLGTLCIIDSRPRKLTPADIELLQDLAHMAQQELAALQLATIDELTRLSNRRGFDALADHVLNLCRRLDQPATLLYFDLDNFKQINDRLGHSAGDRALNRFGEALLATFRDSDVIGRVGGDEFVVLAANARPDAATELLDRLAKSLAESSATNCIGQAIEFSVGTVEYRPADHPDIVALVSEADQLMYREKRAKNSAGN